MSKDITIIKKTGAVYLPDDMAKEFNKINQTYSLVPQNLSVKEVENKAYYLFGKKEYLTKDDFNEINNQINKPIRNREGVYQDINLRVNSKSYNLTYYGNHRASHMVLSYEGDKDDPQKFMIYKIKLNDIIEEFNFINHILKSRFAPHMDGAMRRNININTTKYKSPFEIAISYTTFFSNPQKIGSILKNFLRKTKSTSEFNPKDYKIVII